MNTNEPSEPPPAYSTATSGSGPTTGSTTTSAAAGNPAAQAIAAGEGRAGYNQSSQSTSATASADGGRQPRRGNSSTEELDVEQEDRPLPPGWVPQYSQEHDRFFFVDTQAPGGARSIWTHPLDDPEWLKTVPSGTDPLSYVHQLWANQPEPSSPTGVPDELPPDWAPRRQTQQQQAHSSQTGVAQQLAAQVGSGSGPSSSSGNAGPGHRQGGTHGMQEHYPGTSSMQGGQQRKPLTVEDLTQYYLSKMGTPEEYERKHPPNKLSKAFHKDETPAQRQRRHAESKAREMAEAISFQTPTYGPGSYGYPGYNRGYGGMYASRPGYGMGYGYGSPYGYGRRGGMGYGGYGGGMAMPLMLGLGGGALLGGAMF